MLCWVCQEEAEFIAPGYLCEKHWQAWWDHELTEEVLQYLPQEQREHLLRED
jgi:superfamily II DNA or RNA helicase